MRIKHSLILSLFAALSVSVFAHQKAVAHEFCEPYCNHDLEHLDQVDYWSNYFFKLLRPEMRNKRIRDYHTLYRREKRGIRSVVGKVLAESCQVPNENYYYLLSEIEAEDSKRYEHWQRSDRPQEIRNRVRYNRFLDRYAYDDSLFWYDEELFWDQELWEDGYYWKRSEDYFFEGLYRDLTDAVFFARHPELTERPGRTTHMSWSTEWMYIRQAFADFEQEEFIKEQLIPICKPSQYP